ncbi:GNAT family N-acetyltransferase [Mesobacterium sp. TK19101]|uniref:GNAT family N-acetyltransferase n=1 Tax=Mesobacterium hydrothermale TaxID=3111907 RepID=A0ABU6HGJ3_9RHOB|nr:GNAT family N-acetyltransferase [Mesobacterium sp. TK19101]MEC3860874.1 GNAT family N-acetyltransferase [Mesobacterium sp. TK19101]
MILRRYRAEDRVGCQQVFYDAVRQGAATFYTAEQRAAWAPTPDPDPNLPDKLLQQACFVAVQDDRIVGLMSLAEGGYLDMAFVRPEVMGKGVATALHGAVLDEARAQGKTRLTTHASHLARRFFGRNGWQVDFEEDVALRGQVLHRFGMSLSLDCPGA